MLRRKSVGCQTICRKVSQVPGDDNVCLPSNRRRQHMAIAGIRQVESGGNGLVSRHDGIGKMPIHDRAGSVQHAGVNVGTVSQKAPHPLSMDVGAPQRNIQVSLLQNS